MAVVTKKAPGKSLLEVAVSAIFSDESRNFREPWKYHVEPKKDYDPASTEPGRSTPGFYEDIVENGVRVPIEVSKLDPERQAAIFERTGVKYQYIILRGHRRFRAVTLARKLIGDSIFQSLSCVVYEGLSEVQEYETMYDHGGVEPLSEYERYLAVIGMYAKSPNQERIGQVMGMSRQWVQDQLNIFRLPSVVSAEYRKRFMPIVGDDGKERPPVKGKDYVAFTRKDVDELMPAYNADRNALIDPHAGPSELSQFWSVWETITNKKKAPPATKPLSRTAAENAEGFVRDCEPLREVYSFLQGKGGDIKSAAETYKAIEAKALTADTLRAEVESLHTAGDSLVAEVETLRAELDALRAENETLRAELASVRAGSNGQHVNG